MHPGLRSQAGGPRRLRPQGAGQFCAAQAGAVPRGSRVLFWGQAQPGFAPEQWFALAPIGCLHGRDDDGDHGPVHLGHQGAGGFLRSDHFQRAHLGAMEQTVPAHPAHAHVEAVVFLHALDGLGEAVLGAEVHQHALQPASVSARAHAGAGTEGSRHGPAPAQPPLGFLHWDPTEGGLPVQPLLFTVAAGGRVLGGHLSLGVGVGFVGPVREPLGPQLANLLDDTRFGLIGI